MQVHPLVWAVISSAEQRAGRYTIIHDWTDPEVRVQIDGQMLSTGFDSVAEAKGYCDAHRLGALADQHMIAGARNSIPDWLDFSDASFAPGPWDLRCDADMFLRGIDHNRDADTGNDRAATLLAMFPDLDQGRAADIIRGLEALAALPEPEMDP